MSLPARPIGQQCINVYNPITKINLQYITSTTLPPIVASSTDALHPYMHPTSVQLRINIPVLNLGQVLDLSTILVTVSPVPLVMKISFHLSRKTKGHL